MSVRRGQLLLALVAGMAAIPVVGSASAATTAIPDVTVLFGRAVKLVRDTSRPTYSHAVVYEADGRTRGGRGTSSAAGIISWQFVFENQSSHSRLATATVNYGPPPKGFGKVVGHRLPILGDVPIPKTPKLTLATAVTLLHAAGYRRPFDAVTLRNPLGPRLGNPLYIFGLENGTFVGVDTVTHKVSRLS